MIEAEVEGLGSGHGSKYRGLADLGPSDSHQAMVSKE